MSDTSAEFAPPAVEELPELVVLAAALGDGLIGRKAFRGQEFLLVRREHIVEALQALRDHPDLRYDYFVECLGADYSQWEHARDLPQRFEVLYNLYSTSTYRRAFLKIGVDEGESVPTAKHIYPGAEYPEREVQDLFGVHFAGNGPIEGQRFLLPDDWTGYPLRKDHPLGGEDVLFDGGDRGPAVEDLMVPHAGESFPGRTGTENVSGR